MTSKLSEVFSKLTKKTAPVKKGLTGNVNNRIVAKSSAEKASRNSRINEARGVKLTQKSPNQKNRQGTPQSKGKIKNS